MRTHTLRCSDTDPMHIHDKNECCECGSIAHCCGGCPTLTHIHTAEYREDDDGQLVCEDGCSVCGQPTPKPCSYGEQCAVYIQESDEWLWTFYGEPLA